VIDLNKPFKVWQVLLLVVPAAMAILAGQMAKWWMPPIPPLHLSNGLVLANSARIAVRFAGISLAVIVVSSTIIAFVLARDQQFGGRIAKAMLWMLFLIFVNSFVAFYGCALLRVPSPGKYEIPPESVDASVEKSAAQP